MLFVVLGIDRPGSTVRAERIDAHRAHLQASPLPVPTSGPLLSDDGERMIGSLIVFEAESRAAVEAVMAEDPLVKGGLYQTLEIRRWNQRVGAFVESTPLMGTDGRDQ